MTRTVALDYRKLPSYKALFLDYLHQFERLAPFFAGDPFEHDAWGRVASTLSQEKHPRATVAGNLRELNRKLGGDEAALRSAGAIEDGALVVVSGQQVGLFGGPLYTLYKALTAVRLARSASSRLGRAVVPIFWMDGDDHDFAEVQGTYLLDKHHQPAAVRYEVDDAEARLPVGRRELTGSIEASLQAAFEVAPPSEFTDEVRRGLKECYAPGRTMAEAFGSWLLRLTRGTGLAVIDPSAAELKAAATAVFEREVIEGSESSAIVKRTTARLLAQGYHAQASPADSQLNLFYANPLRDPIAIVNGSLRIGGNEAELTREQVAQRVRTEPAAFSPNVLLRPLYQDTILPTLAYVAGPNELAYFAQLKDVYEHFGVTMPLVASRASFTLVERPQARFLSRYEVDVTGLSADDESLLNDILKRFTPPELADDLNRARHCIQEITHALERDLGKVDPTLAPTVKSTRGKLLHLLKDLEGKAMKAVKRQHETVRSQFLATRSALFPEFEMQERKLSPVGFLNKYGWHFARMVEESTDPEVKAHFLLDL